MGFLIWVAGSLFVPRAFYQFRFVSRAFYPITKGPGDEVVFVGYFKKQKIFMVRVSVVCKIRQCSYRNEAVLHVMSKFSKQGLGR